MPASWNQCQQHDSTCSHPRCQYHGWFSSLKCTVSDGKNRWAHYSLNYTKGYKENLIEEKNTPYLLLRNHRCVISITSIFKTCTAFLLPQHQWTKLMHQTFPGFQTRNWSIQALHKMNRVTVDLKQTSSLQIISYSARSLAWPNYQKQQWYIP